METIKIELSIISDDLNYDMITEAEAKEKIFNLIFYGELERFMIWYKNNVPIGTMKKSKELVDEYLKR